VVPAALALLAPALRARIELVQQARPEDVEAVRHLHAARGIAAIVESFFTDIPMRLARAHLVIARAGASTVAELCAIGRPAILVPYRYAADNHQTANAEALARAGAAWTMREAEFTPKVLAEKLIDLVKSQAQLTAAAEAARKLGAPDAAKRLADLVIATAQGAAA
jgi:UDP-N-acetylglucosamine--N-acetylmuramyl-(pentapeptide) pyrophosphoryl-undecaprenol N-acetylglucosamine transferase